MGAPDHSDALGRVREGIGPCSGALEHCVDELALPSAWTIHGQRIGEDKKRADKNGDFLNSH